MTWIIIILVLALAIGPVAYLIPSAKDKRLAKLRQAAAQQGVGIRLTPITQLDPTPQQRVNAAGERQDPKIMTTAYQSPLQNTLRKPVEFTLLRLPENTTVHTEEVIPGWCPDPRQGGEGWREFVAIGGADTTTAIEKLLEQLPRDVVGISTDSRMLSALWLEGPDSQLEALSQIIDFHNNFREQLVQRIGIKTPV